MYRILFFALFIALIPMVCLAGPEELCIRVNESNNQTCEVKRLKSDGSMTFWLSDNSIVSVRFDREDYSMTVGWSDYTLVTSVFSKFNVVLINNQNGAVQQIDPETQITIGPLTIGPNWKISINDIGTNVPPDIILPDGLILVRTENNQYIAFFENGPNEIVHRTNLPEYLSNSIQETFRLVGINFGDLESTNYLYTNNAKEAADKGYFFEPPSGAYPIDCTKLSWSFSCSLLINSLGVRSFSELCGLVPL